MHHRLSPSNLRKVELAVLALLAVSPCACRRIPEPEPVAAAPAQQDLSAKQEAAPAPTPQPENVSTPANGYAKVGWDWETVRDSLPICAFSNVKEREKAPFLHEVKPQTLAANAKVVFGAFPPWCINEACDDRPTMQCWVEREGETTLVVHTFYTAYRKTGSTCTTGCMDVDVSCETEELKPGTYTIRHGEKSFKLQIPSKLKKLCFK